MRSFAGHHMGQCRNCLILLLVITQLYFVFMDTIRASPELMKKSFHKHSLFENRLEPDSNRMFSLKIFVKRILWFLLKPQLSYLHL